MRLNRPSNLPYFLHAGFCIGCEVNVDVNVVFGMRQRDEMIGELLEEGRGDGGSGHGVCERGGRQRAKS